MNYSLLKKFVYYSVIVFIITANNYIISTNYSPNKFDRPMLLQKKYRCIRYYQDTKDYNKHMEKTCTYYKKDNEEWTKKKYIYKVINMIAIITGLLIVAF